jgi:hypothetical protein
MPDGINLNLCGMYSRGSKNHTKGQCRPCKKVAIEGGCPDGDKCNFCHYFHEGKEVQQIAMSGANIIDEKPNQEKKQTRDEPWYVSLPPPSGTFRAPPGLPPPPRQASSRFASYEQALSMQREPCMSMF